MIAASACCKRVSGQHGLNLRSPLNTKAALALLLPVLAAAQTGLNDTGQTAGHTPSDDARYGRDAKAMAGTLAKTGGGAAGFDFTALDGSGNATTPGSHACVKDNTTGLTWEVKQTGADSSQLRHADHRYAWHDSPGGNTCNGTLGQCNTQAYVAAVNALTANDRLCGKTGWRMPTRRELLSIVHNGVFGPAIDPTYFPDVGSNGYWWTSETYAPNPAGAWIVNFDGGDAGAYGKFNSISVRLVRSGQ